MLLGTKEQQRKKEEATIKTENPIVVKIFFLFCLTGHFIVFIILFYFITLTSYSSHNFYPCVCVCVATCNFLSKNIWLTGLSNACQQACLLLLFHFAALKITQWQKRIKENLFFESRTLNNYKSLATAQLMPRKVLKVSYILAHNTKTYIYGCVWVYIYHFSCSVKSTVSCVIIVIYFYKFTSCYLA